MVEFARLNILDPAKPLPPFSEYFQSLFDVIEILQHHVHCIHYQLEIDLVKEEENKFLFLHLTLVLSLTQHLVNFMVR